jgi:hypothetical protein
MYLYSRLGQASLAQQSTQTIVLSSFVSAIQDLANSLNSQDWVTANNTISKLLSDPNLASSAGTLIEPLKALQILIKNPDPSKVQDSSSNLLSLAQTEASSSPEERIINLELLNNRLFELKQEIDDFSSKNVGFKAIIAKVRGKTADLFAPLKQDLDNLQTAIASTPLTVQGRAEIQARFGPLQSDASDIVNLATGGTLKYAGVLLVSIISTAAIAWIVEKSKEKAVHHAKKIHHKIRGTKEEDKKEEKPKRIRKRRKA